MKIAVLKERRPHEARVAASPETVKKFTALGLDVVIEAGAGAGSSIPDAAFEGAGASIAKSAAETVKGADLVLKVQKPMAGEGDELALLGKGAHLVSLMNPLGEPDDVKQLAATGASALALELMPRITRAQAMDVLSSQSNLAGYRAVLEAAHHYKRAFPMMMTAAGTIAPAKLFVMGAGVAGLQAIATGRRLGAVVSATDVRRAAGEQVESLGAKFVMVDEEDDAETEGGYAKEMSEDYKRRQAELIAKHIPKQDIVITTALIPGKPAPTLVTDDMMKSMKPGSVIVDMAVEQGGNCTLSKPGEVVEVDGVTIVGLLNLPSRIAADASLLFAKNVYTFVEHLLARDEDGKVKPELDLDRDDEIISATLVVRDGKIVHPQLAEKTGD